MAVLTILVTAVAFAVSNMLKITRESRVTSGAADYAQSVVERYRSYWGDPNKYFDTSVVTAPGYPPFYATVPDISDLNSKLDSSYKITIDPHEMLNPDGTPFTPPATPTATDIPPARRLRVVVEQPAGRIRAQLSTVIGSR